MGVCSFLASHFEEKVSFQVKITLNTGGLGNIYICTLLDTAFRGYFYDCDRSC